MDYEQLSNFQKRFLYAYDCMITTGICSFMYNFYQEWYYVTDIDRKSIKDICQYNLVIYSEEGECVIEYRMKDWQKLREEVYDHIKERL